MKQMPASKLLCVAEGLRDIIKLMLNSTPEVRADAHQFVKVLKLVSLFHDFFYKSHKMWRLKQTKKTSFQINYFEDVGVKTLNYLDSLFQWDNLQKSQFYKGLPDVINKLPHRVCLNRLGKKTNAYLITVCKSVLIIFFLNF